MLGQDLLFLIKKASKSIVTESEHFLKEKFFE